MPERRPGPIGTDGGIAPRDDRPNDDRFKPKNALDDPRDVDAAARERDSGEAPRRRA